MHLECVLAWILLLWTSQCWTDAKEERREGEGEGLPGHMQPLGSHMTPEYVKRVWGKILRGSEFVEQYVHPKQPVIFEGLIKDLQVRKNWASDKYLRCGYGRTKYLIMIITSLSLHNMYYIYCIHYLNSLVL